MQSELTEKQFQNMVLTTARQLGWREYHTYDSRRSNPGFPDLVLVKPPRVIFAELKTSKPKRYPTPVQKEWLDDLEACPGVECYLWRPADWNDLVDILHGGA